MARLFAWLGRSLSELRRRNVLHVAAVYAVVAWVVIEVSSTVFPALYLPQSAVTLVVLLCLLGFPVALVLAWAFELTPEGARRSPRAAGPPPGEPATGRHAVAPWLLLLAALVATAGAVWTAWRVSTRPAATATAAEEVAAPGDTAEEASGIAAFAAAADGGLDPMRIAVLYFDDRSEAQDLDGLARGLTEDLTHELAQAKGLDVMSRHAVKPYRQPGASLDSIARHLGAGSLVEGSVDRAGGRLRVTVQLVDGATGTQLASERLVSAAGDPLAMRDDLVRRVARLLRRELGREIDLRQTRAGAADPVAWRLYHQARERVEYADTLRRTRQTDAARRLYVESDSLLGEAERLDPGWPAPSVERGWVAFARAKLEAGGSVSGMDVSTLTAGIGHAERALEASPGHASALELRGALLYFLAQLSSAEKGPALLRDAEEDLRAAMAADPEQPLAWLWLARLLLDGGRFGEARFALRRSREADPFLDIERENLFISAALAADLGDAETATRLIREQRRLFPGNPAFEGAQLTVAAGSGAPEIPADTAWHLLRSVAAYLPEGRWPQGELLVAAVLARAGLPDSAEAVFARASRTAGTDPFTHYYAANALLQLGRREEAVERLGAYLQAHPQRRDYVANEGWWQPLRDHPGFRALVDAGATE